MKEKIKSWLTERSGLQGQALQVEDAGSANLVEGDDYVDYAKRAIQSVTSSGDRVILFCRNGFGMMMAANRFIGSRCGLAFEVEAVRKGRTDDDINCLSIPADYVDEKKVREMIEVFLNEEFSREEKYKRRVMKLDNLL